MSEKTDIWTLAEDELAAVKKHLSDKLVTGCWVCQENDWIIHPTVTGEKPYDPTANFIAVADSAPKVRITCKNCGNIGYFSTDVMGLSRPEDQSDG